MGNQTSVLHDAAAKNNIGVVRRLLDQERMDPNARDKVRGPYEQHVVADLDPSPVDLAAVLSHSFLMGPSHGACAGQAEPVFEA